MSVIEPKTAIPGPRSREPMARREAAVPRGPYNATPIFVKEARGARGARLVDVDGNRLLDFAGGIGCVNVLTSQVHPYKAGFGPFAPEVYVPPTATATAVPTASSTRAAPCTASTLSRTSSRDTSRPIRWRR